MSKAEVPLRDVIERFLTPIKGRSDVVKLCRFMTSHLDIDPRSIRGRLNAARLLEEVKRKLIRRLLASARVYPGDQVTYWCRNGRSKGWGPPRTCRVIQVNILTLTLEEGERVNSQAVPLYCSELLEQIGLKVDFAELTRREAALWSK